MYGKAYRYERPLHGEFGSVSTIGDRLVCHLCGNDFVNLASHVRQAHGVLVDEYKAMFGLNRNHSLWANSLRRSQSRQQTARGLGDLGRAASARRTPAQRTKNMQQLVLAARDKRPEEITRLRALARANAKKGNDAARAAGVLDWRARQTHCKHGHEFTLQNTAHPFKDHPTWRSCRACDRDRMRAIRAANRAHATPPTR